MMIPPADFRNVEHLVSLHIVPGASCFLCRLNQNQERSGEPETLGL